jgi:hypothetical protein
MPVRMKLRLPDRKKDTTIYVLSNSFEYDVDTIKNIPQPRMNYKHIIIPFIVNDKIAIYPFRYRLPQNEYNRYLMYLNSQKDMIPKLMVIPRPYPQIVSENVYVPLSDIFKAITPIFMRLGKKYVREHVQDIFMQILNFYKFSPFRVLIINCDAYRIFNEPTQDAFSSDIINALISVYFFSHQARSRKLPVTIVFRSGEADYKFDLSAFEDRDLQRFRAMLKVIGKPVKTSGLGLKSEDDIDDEGDIDEEGETPEAKKVIGQVVEDEEETEEIDEEDDTPKVTARTVDQIKAKVNSIKAVMKADGDVEVDDDDEEVNSDKKVREAKELRIQAELLKRITVNTGKVGNYKTIADDMTSSTDNKVESQLIDDASKKISSVAVASNTKNAMDTRSTAREEKMRERIGKLKLGNISFNTLTSVTDIPKPEPIKPLRISTINKSALQGTGFTKISKAYEENLMDRDIVQTFVNLSKISDGFEITNVEVTDISDVNNLINNWRVSLRSKSTGRLNTINIRVPKVNNGKFYYNGTWYNIGKQDFPIPILKLNPKRVMLTSNYNKITVERYDTKSLVDVTSLVKILSNLVNERGESRYIKPGTSTTTNARFLSTVEFDEYAKMWLSFVNKEKKIEIYFNRMQCLKQYGFVSVEDNEFCCGMIDQVPIILNTDTGLTRDERTLTEIIVNSLPPDLQQAYQKMKPGKRSMFATMNAGGLSPVGVTCCAWEGLTNVLKKVNVEYKIVQPRDPVPIGYMGIVFKDCKLVIKNTISNQLFFNGFNMIETKDYPMADFEVPIMNSNSIYIDIYNKHFFKQYSQLTTFITCYNFFVDAVTYDVCSHYNIPNDVVGMLIYAVNMLADNNFVVEQTSSLYRIRSTEVIPAIIHDKIAHAISKYNNSPGSKSRDHMLKFNQNSVILELVTLGTTESSSALNPMVELHQGETITQRGFHGVNEDRAYTKYKRSYHDTMIGKEALSTPNSASVGINRQLVADPKIESVRGYTSTDGPDTQYNDLQLASFSELLTPGTVSHDDAVRTAIATSQTSHIVSTAAAAPVLISNGVDEIAPTSLSDEFSVTADEDGKVIEIKDNFMIIKYKSGKTQAVQLGDRYHANPASGFYVDNKLTTHLKANDSFKKGEVIAYHEKFFTRGFDGVVRLNVGPIAKVAFMSTYSTYEDSGMMTESFSRKLASNITMLETIKLDATANVESIVKIGDEVEIGDPLVVLGLGDTGDKSVDNFLKSFRADSGSSIIDSAKRVFKSKHAGKVVDIKMYTTKSMDRLSDSLFKILDAHFKDNAKKKKVLDKYDKSSAVYKMGVMLDHPTGPLKGQEIKGIRTDVLIEIFIEHEDLQSVGDKLVAYAASKQVIAEVVPVGEEPYTESNPDEEISVFVSARSILKRMIPSITVTATGNKVLIETKKKIKEIWNS